MAHLYGFLRQANSTCRAVKGRKRPLLLIASGNLGQPEGYKQHVTHRWTSWRIVAHLYEFLRQANLTCRAVKRKKKTTPANRIREYVLNNILGRILIYDSPPAVTQVDGSPAAAVLLYESPGGDPDWRFTAGCKCVMFWFFDPVLITDTLYRLKNLEKILESNIKALIRFNISSNESQKDDLWRADVSTKMIKK